MVNWFQNNDYSQFPMVETQPFIYIPETQQLHMGNPGGHHWEIFNKDIDHTGLYGLYNPVRNNAMLYPLDQQGNRENIDISAENFMAARRAINSMLSKQSSAFMRWIWDPETNQVIVSDEGMGHGQLSQQFGLGYEWHGGVVYPNGNVDTYYGSGYHPPKQGQMAIQDLAKQGGGTTTLPRLSAWEDPDIARWVYFPKTDTVEFGGMDDEHMDLVQRGSPMNFDGNYANFYGGYVNKDGSLDLTYTPDVNWVPTYMLGEGNMPPPPEVAAKVQEELAKQKTAASADVKFIYNPETKDIKVWTTDAEGNPTHADGLMDSGWHWPIVPGGVRNGEYYVMAEGPLANEATRAFQEAEQKTSAWEDPDELYNRLTALFML